jgi:hypothetical protein
VRVCKLTPITRDCHRICTVVFAGLLLALGCSWQAGADAIRLDESLRWRNITPQSSYLLDPEGTQRIEDVSALPASSFDSPHQNSYNFGINPGIVWIRLEFRNETERRIWILELNNPRLEEVRAFQPLGAGEWTEQAVGTDRPVSERLALHVLPALKLRLLESESTVAYLRVKHTGSTRFQLQLSTMERFRQQVTNRTAATFILVGGLLVMFFFNVIVFLQLRERTYFYLAGAVFTFLAFTMALNGSGYLWVWPDAHWWSGRSVTTSAMVHFTLLCLFFREFLRNVEGAARIRQLSVVLIVVFAGLSIIALTDWSIKYFLIGGIGMVGPLVIEAAAVYVWWKGYKPALQFVIAWVFGVAGGIYFTGINAGLIEHSYLRETAISIGYLLSVIFWNLSLVERLRVSEAATREKLEEQVKQRTMALTQALDEVRTLSGLLPICSSCSKIRDDKGYWQGVEQYLHEHTGAQLSHGMCPECMGKMYPDYAARVAEFEHEQDDPPAAPAG